MSETSPFIDESRDIPAVDRRGRCYGSSQTGECSVMDLEFDTIDEWKEHRRKYHPYPCSKHGCDNIASYSYTLGPTSYCVKHMPDKVDVSYAWRRANQESVVKPPRLPDDHPVETALSGLGV